MDARESASRVARAAIAAGLVLCARGVRGADEPPSESALRAIADRGREISLYEEATEKGREALKRSPQEVLPPDHVVVHEDRHIWRVIFLKDVVDKGVKKGMKILAEMEFYPATGEAGMLRLMAPPRSAQPLTMAYARAMQEAVKSAAARGGLRVPYDEALVREPDGAFSIYLRSRSAEDGTAQFGADLLVRVAPTGRETISLEPLHTETTVISNAPRRPGEPTLHVHPSGDLPAPTDVAQVLRVPALAPHLVLTPRFMFRIDSEGRITYLGPRQPPAPATPGGAR